VVEGGGTRSAAGGRREGQAAELTGKAWGDGRRRVRVKTRTAHQGRREGMVP
jgi:hypothetical protein